MRSAYAEAIAMFLAGGGKVTHCPEGNALIGHEPPRKKPVGNAARNCRRMNRMCDAVLLALQDASEPLTLLGIEKRTAIPYNHLRGVMSALEKSGQVISEGGGKGRVLRYRMKPANTNQAMSEVA